MVVVIFLAVVVWQEVFGCCVVAGDIKRSPYPRGEQARRQTTQRLTTKSKSLCVQPLPTSYPSSCCSSLSSCSSYYHPASTVVSSTAVSYPASTVVLSAVCCIINCISQLYPQLCHRLLLHPLQDTTLSPPQSYALHAFQCIHNVSIMLYTLFTLTKSLSHLPFLSANKSPAWRLIAD